MQEEERVKLVKDSAPTIQLTEQEIAEIQAKTKLSSLSQAKAKIAGYRLESLEKDMAVTSAQLYESKMNIQRAAIYGQSIMHLLMTGRASAYSLMQEALKL